MVKVVGRSLHLERRVQRGIGTGRRGHWGMVSEGPYFSAGHAVFFFVFFAFPLVMFFFSCWLHKIKVLLLRAF